MDVKSIFKVEGAIISVAHFLGASSYKWNSITYRFEKSSRAIDRIKRNCVIVIMTFLKLAIISSSISQMNLMIMTHFEGAFHIYSSLFSVVSLACELHMVIKEEEIPSFVNSFNLFMEYFLGKYEKKDVGKKIPPTTYILVGVVWIYISVAFIAGALPLLNIKCNFFLPLLRGFISDDPSLGFRVALSITHFVACIYVNGSFFVDTVLAVPFATNLTIIGLESAKSAPRTYTTLEFCTPRNFLTTVRAVDILVNHMEDCILYSLYPVAVAFLLSATTLGLAALIRVDLPFLALLALISTLVAVLTFLYCFVIWPVGTILAFNNSLVNLDVTEVASVGQNLKNAEASTSARGRTEVGYLKKLKKSVRPVRIRVGMFAKLDKGLPEAVFDLIISKTVDVLLLFQ